jgi:hypothetical protein
VWSAWGIKVEGKDVEAEDFERFCFSRDIIGGISSASSNVFFWVGVALAR